MDQLRHKNSETIIFTATIAMVGVVESMAHGQLIGIAPALPLVAALQLVAGIRLGPLRGFIASVIGTYLLVAFRYWSFAPIEVIQDPLLAGSPVNALLPSLLLRLFQTDPFRVKELRAERKAIFTLFFFLTSVIITEVLPILFGVGGWTYRTYVLASALLLASVASITVLRSTARENGKTFSLFMILVISSLMSSVIGSTHSITATKWNAMIDTAIPWLLWNITYSIVVIQLLVMLDLGAGRGDTQINNNKLIAFGTKYKKYYHSAIYSLCIAYFAGVWCHPDPVFHGCDLHCYFLAAKGDYSGYHVKIGIISWMYPRFTALLWKPFLYLDFEIAFSIMFSIGCMSYLWLTHELLKKNIGGLIALVGLKSFQSQVVAGNIYPPLAALAAYPLGIIVGTIFKFPIAGVGFILFFVQYRRRKMVL